MRFLRLFLKIAVGLTVLLALAVTVTLWSLGRMDEDLIARLSAAIGEPVRVDELDTELFPPGVRVTAFAVGEPVRVAAGELSLGLDVLESLRHWRLHLEASLRDVDLDLRPGEAAEAERGGDTSFGFSLPIELVLRLERLSVQLSDDRRISVARAHVRGKQLAIISAEAELGAEGVLLEGEGRVVVDRARAMVHSHRRRLIIDKVELRGPSLALDAGPDDSAPASGGTLAPTRVRFRGQAGDLIDFFAGHTGVEATVMLDASIEGALADPKVEGHLEVEDARYDELRLSRVSAEVRRSKGIWRADELEVSWPQGRVSGDLTIVEESTQLAGNLEWTGLDLARQPDPVSRLDAKSSGQARLEIDLRRLMGNGEASGWLGRDKQDAARFRTTFAVSDDSLRGWIELEGEAENRLRVDVERDGSDGLAGTGKLELAAVDRMLARIGYRPPLSIAGALSADVRLEGSTRDPKATAKVRGTDLRLGQGPKFDLRGAGRVSSARVLFEDAELRFRDGGFLRAHGGIAFEAEASNSVEWELAGIEVATLLVPLMRPGDGVSQPPLAGVLQGSGRIEGAWEDVRAEGGVRVEGGRLDGIELAELSIDGVATGETWTALARVANAGAGRGRVEVKGCGAEMTEVEALVSDWPVRELLLSQSEELSGTVDLNGKFEAVGPVGRGSVELATSRLSLEGRSVGGSRIEAIGDDTGWRLSGRLLDGSATLRGTVQAQAGAPFEVRIGLHEATFPLPLPTSSETDVTSGGELVASGSVAEIAASEVTLTLDTLRLASGSQRLVAADGLRAAWQQDRLRLQPLTLRGGSTELSLEGELSEADGVELRVAGSLGLMWLAQLSTVVEELSGAAQVDLSIHQRREGEPQIRGSISLQGAGVEIAGLPPATAVGGKVELSPGSVRVDSLAGQMGGGEFRLAGAVDMQSGPALDWSFQEVAVAPDRGLDVVLSGNGRISGAWDDALLEGDIAIVEMLYDRNIELGDFLPSFGRTLAPAPARRASRPPLRLNVRVVAPDGLYVENNVATVEGRADVTIGGSARSPRPVGEIAVVDGEVIVRGRKFDVVNGVVRFRRELPGAAYLDFLAESVIESNGVPYRVQMHLVGTSDDYRVLLESDEGLSDGDIASLIAFGKTLADLKGSGESEASTLDQVAVLAGGQLGGLVSKELENTLPFDEIEIRPGFSATTGEFEPQIRIGKSITNDLSAWIAQSFGVQPQTGLEVSYAVTRDISGILRWESRTETQAGAVGGEISQSFDFWGLPGWPWWGAAD